MNHRSCFFWISIKIVPPKRHREGSKIQYPRLFPLRLLLGHPDSERGALELHFGSPGSQKDASECHFGLVFATFVITLLAGRQHCIDTENPDNKL